MPTLVEADAVAVARIEIGRDAGVRFAAHVRGHRIVYDQPLADGGTDAGPTPTEAFVASLAACVMYYVERFLERHSLDPDGLGVVADFTMAQHPSRVGAITMTVEIPGGMPNALRAPLLAVANACTVHNSILTPPELQISVATIAPEPRAEATPVG